MFDKFALNRNNTYKELHKDGFMELLRDAEILILPKKVEVEKPNAKGKGKSKADQEKKQKEEEAKKAEEAKKEDIQLFVEEDAMNAII